MALTRILPSTWGMLVLLAACNPPPGLEAGARIAPSNQPVELRPLDALLAQAQGGVADDASAAALAARAALLKARAAAN